MVRFSNSLAVAAAAAAFFTSSIALAGPFYQEEELFEMAHVVVDATVADIRCTGATSWGCSDVLDPHVEGTCIEQNYDHELTTLNVLKGEIDETFALAGSQIDRPPGIDFGCMDPSYVLPKGWTGRLYLYRGSGGKLYVVDWGAAVKDPDASVLHQLPVCEPKADPNPKADPSPNDSEPEEPTPAESPAQGCSLSAGTQATDPRGFVSTVLLGLALMFGRRKRR